MILEAIPNQFLLLPSNQNSLEQIQRISIGVDKNESNGWSGRPSISNDGRYIVFSSDASNLIPDDTNESTDVFLYDRETDELVRVSVANDKTEANSFSDVPSISADGRYITFQSWAENLVANDTNSTQDIFVYDRVEANIRRVSVKADGSQTEGISSSPTISADGRFVAFVSAGELVPDDTNQTWDVFRFDQHTGEIRQISLNFRGFGANGSSFAPSISSDGRFIAFSSNATNLVSNDTNGTEDVFVVDLQTGVIERISVLSNGWEARGRSYGAKISGDGRFVVFVSGASNFVDSDVNGVEDVFVHDRETGQTNRVSELPEDARLVPGEFRNSGMATISLDGRFVAFYRNPTFGSLNFPYGYFLYDLISSQVTHIASSFDDEVGNGRPALSADGRYIAFGSDDDTLVPDDTNGNVDVFVLELTVSPLPTPEPTATVIATLTSTPTLTETPTNTVTPTASSSPTLENTIEAVPGVEETVVVEESDVMTPTPDLFPADDRRNGTLLMIITGLGVLVILGSIVWVRSRS